MRNENVVGKGRLIFAVLILICLINTCPGKTSKGLSCKTLQTISRVKMSYGRYKEAEDFAEKALQKALDNSVPIRKIAVYASDLSYVYMKLGLLEDAEGLCRSALFLQEKEYGPDHPYIGYTKRSLANILRKQNNFEQALNIIEQAQQIIAKNHPGDKMVMAPFEVDKARILIEMKKYEQAEQILEDAFDVIEKSYGSEHIFTAKIKGFVARVYVLQGYYDKAVPLIHESIETRKKVFGEGNPNFATDMMFLAEVFYTRGFKERAFKIVKKINSDWDLNYLQENIKSKN